MKTNVSAVEKDNPYYKCGYQPERPKDAMCSGDPADVGKEALKSHDHQ
jgi:hypothetical protein